ncbi:hypothetical protein NMG60_11008134 [Bertholletia excelsa]
MKKHSLLSRNSGTYTSPGTPDYGEISNDGGVQKGWCSERVPLPSNHSRRHVNAAALLPFTSGRALPSKWDDAERWITSPVSGCGVNKTSFAQLQRRPKSKSGPLGAPGIGYFSNYSPAVPVLQGGSVRDFMVGSPFTAGVLLPDSLSIQYNYHSGAQANAMHTGTSMPRAVSMPGWSDLLSESSLRSSQDEKAEGCKDTENMVSRVVSRRDMATQMSPRESTHSSPRGRSSFSTSSPSMLPTVEQPQSPKMDIKDVQVDKRVTTKGQSKKHGIRKMKNGSADAKDLISSWDIAEGPKNMSKLQREEAKITAWENLQKAKAEAAIRKLEMKLEKKRSASMDKILNKLRIAQMKAQGMRSSLLDSNARPVPKASSKGAFFSKYVKMGSVRGCFQCCAT